MHREFYGGMSVEVIYRDKENPEGSSRIHFYNCGGMIPQFVLPNLLAAKKLRDTLSKIIEEEEEASKKRNKKS